MAKPTHHRTGIPVGELRFALPTLHSDLGSRFGTGYTYYWQCNGRSYEVTLYSFPAAEALKIVESMIAQQ